MEHTFTDENFAIEVLQSPTLVFVDFWAEWCGPCKMMEPVVAQLANDLDASKIKIGKLNVDQNQQTSGQYGVMSIPTFLIFKGGQVVDQIVGTMTKEALKERVMKHVT
jgi:thioredoxin 1